MSKERKRFRLDQGMGRLEEWANTANQVDKNAIYKVLFSVADGSVFRTYKVLDDVHQSQEFFVLVRENLVVKICYHEHDAFGIIYIGPIDEAPDIDLGLDIDKTAEG